MCGLMGPLVGGILGVSEAAQISLFHPLSQVSFLGFFGCYLL
jgi:hypothetical protein